MRRTPLNRITDTVVLLTFVAGLLWEALRHRNQPWPT